MDAGLWDVAPRHYGLEPLLDRLLRVEADDPISDLRVPRELPNRDGVLLCLPR